MNSKYEESAFQPKTRSIVDHEPTSTSVRMCVPDFRGPTSEGRRNPPARQIYPRYSICLDVGQPGTEFRVVLLGVEFDRPAGCGLGGAERRALTRFVARELRV